MAVGIECPQKYSYKDTGYCFVEVARPIIITDAESDYIGAGKLVSSPEIVHISDGYSFDSVSEEFYDSLKLRSLNEQGESTGYLEQGDYNTWQNLINKYGIEVSE